MKICENLINSLLSLRLYHALKRDHWFKNGMFQMLSFINKQNLRMHLFFLSQFCGYLKWKRDIFGNFLFSLLGFLSILLYVINCGCSNGWGVVSGETLLTSTIQDGTAHPPRPWLPFKVAYSSHEYLHGLLKGITLPGHLLPAGPSFDVDKRIFLVFIALSSASGNTELFLQHFSVFPSRYPLKNLKMTHSSMML